MNRRPLYYGLAAALVSLALSACSSPPADTGAAQAAVTVLENFTLIDGTGSPAAADSALVMGEDGRIASGSVRWRTSKLPLAQQASICQAST